jgi:PAS domain S-box-containing protein
VHPADRRRVWKAVARALRERVFDTELRVLHADGRVRWVRASGRAVGEGPGPPEHLIGVNVDITLWKEAELALRGSEARNRAILRAMPDLMFLQDREGRYLDYHARDAAQLLVPPERFLGRRMDQVLPPELAARLRSCLELALRGGGPAVAEYSVEIGGSRRHVEARLVRCGTDSVLSIVRDVTLARQAQAALAEREEQLRALTARLLTAQEEERSRVAREIHDDAGQQLAALAFEVTALERRPGSAQGADAGALAALQRSIEALAASIRGISHRLHPSVLDFAGLAAALRSHCAEAGAGMGVSVHLDVAPRADCVARETALAAYRIVQEALRNVARHAAAENAWVAVSRGRGELRVRVRDDGRGMAAGARATEGLGLVSMRERARLVGGTLHVSSPAGGGTCVDARLPVRRPRSNPKSSE